MNNGCFKQSAMLRAFVLVVVALVATVSFEADAEWSIDLSRRTQHMRKEEMTRAPASVRSFEDATNSVPAYQDPAAATSNKAEDTTFLGRLFDPGEPVQDIVILNTDRGFVPNVVRVRRDGRYVIHVVNVNEKEKNVSFILDGFSEHHATYFGKLKTFRLEPKKDGVYSFLSPETSAEGRLIVFGGPVGTESLRQPAQTGPVEKPKEELVGGLR